MGDLYYQTTQPYLIAYPANCKINLLSNHHSLCFTLLKNDPLLDNAAAKYSCLNRLFHCARVCFCVCMF